MCSPQVHTAGGAGLWKSQEGLCQGTVEFPSQGKPATVFPSLHGSLELSCLPDWELAVTILVSTVPFLGMGSVLEELRVGLALADRLPLSKRLTSSNSVPGQNPKVNLQAQDSFPSPNAVGRTLRTSASHTMTWVSFIIFALSQFTALINLALCYINNLINTVHHIRGQHPREILSN